MGEMNPADVSEEWLQAAFDAIGRPGTGDGDEQMRHVLAAVLPLHGQQLRAERDEWHRQNGLLRGELAVATARAEQAEAALAELREIIAAQIAGIGENIARNARPTGPLAVVARTQADTYRTAAWLIRNPDQFGNRDATPRTNLERAADEPGDDGPDPTFEMLDDEAPKQDPHAVAEYWREWADTCSDSGRNYAWTTVTQVVARILAAMNDEQAADPPLTERQAQLLAAIRREGGDWSPARARDALSCVGIAVEPNRAHQIMKALAGRGLLEQVRPRAYTYRLKNDGGGSG